MNNMIERCRRYVAAMQPAVAFHGGMNRMRETVHAIFDGFALDENDGWPLLQEYNRRCQPPWSENTLRHFMTEMLKKAKQNPNRGELRHPETMTAANLAMFETMLRLNWAIRRSGATVHLAVKGDDQTAFPVAIFMTDGHDLFAIDENDQRCHDITDGQVYDMCIKQRVYGEPRPDIDDQRTKENHEDTH